MKTFKTRHQFYLPDALSEQLEAVAAKPGSSKTAILTDALTAFFERRAGHELDQRFGVRLDRLSRGQVRTERQLAILSEAFGLFVQFQLTQLAHQPPADHETGLLGLKRYRAFIEQVGRRVAGADEGVRLTAIGDDDAG
jgi:predicted transcriptional regulator